MALIQPPSLAQERQYGSIRARSRFDANWNSDRNLSPSEFFFSAASGAGQGAWAFVDGAIDFIPLVDFKPFEQLGMYDSSMYGLHYSQKIGAVTRDTFAFFKIAKGWQAMSSWGGGMMSVQGSYGLAFAGYGRWSLFLGGPTTTSLTTSFLTTNAMRWSTVEDLFSTEP